jgi:hypothetical protein
MHEESFIQIILTSPGISGFLNFSLLKAATAASKVRLSKFSPPVLDLIFYSGSIS